MYNVEQWFHQHEQNLKGFNFQPLCLQNPWKYMEVVRCLVTYQWLTTPICCIEKQASFEGRMAWYGITTYFIVSRTTGPTFIFLIMGRNFIGFELFMTYGHWNQISKKIQYYKPSSWPFGKSIGQWWQHIQPHDNFNMPCWYQRCFSKK